MKGGNVGQLKVLVVGLDGATLDLVGPWADQGYLPTFSHLMQEGTSGPLLSTFPPLTGPAWSSFMTGKSPGRHGVLEFFRLEQGSYRQVLNNRYDIDGRSLWRLLSDAGKTVGVMGVPLTYPPEPVNGFLITGLLTPPGRADFAYPADLLQELERHVGRYRLRHDEKYQKSDPSPFLREQGEILENNLLSALYLITHKPWDFFMLHFLGTDRIQHEFWHVLDPSHPQHDVAERLRLGNVVLDFFRQIDAALGRLFDAVDDETVVIIMSDHGLGPVHKFINVNVWLLEQGLLCLKSTPATRVRGLLFRAGLNYSTMGHLTLDVGLGRRAKSLGRARRENLQRRLFLSLDDVDWSRTKVYSIGSFGQLHVNLRGREPQGIVSPGAEYGDLLDDLTRRLHALTDPETGEAVVERVFRREQLYTGPHAERSPDLMFLTRRMEYKALGLADFACPRVFEPAYGTTGHHRMNGLLICRGKGVIKEGARVDGARIRDLAPTILHIMGQPVPREMDGAVLTDLFDRGYGTEKAVAYSGSCDASPAESASVYTPTEEAGMMERLRSLGYGL